MTNSLHVHTLILGGGLTGLSAAYHLEQAGMTDYLLVEKEASFGGLCASETVRGFTFDRSGHLLHLRDPYALRLVKKLLGKNLHKLNRRAFISFDGRRVPFPFQANLWALPENVRQECLLGALEAAANASDTEPENFEQWCLRAFGPGIYKHFMRPYNRKLWQTEPKRMTWDWCGAFVPKPDVRQIRTGAAKRPAAAYGYNASFYYPLRGGCGALADALAARVPNTWLNACVTRINFKTRTARINGKTVHFKRLINTLPLKDFIGLCAAPTAVRAAAKRLTSTTVHVLNIALDREVKDFHWVYFPQTDVPFYRAGAMSSFSPANAPKGCGSLYVETAEKITDFNAARRAFYRALRQKGIIDKQAKIQFSFWRSIPSAYAVYDAHRAQAVALILQWLKQNSCTCAGRYGRWEYSFMERSLLQGRDAAKELL